MLKIPLVLEKSDNLFLGRVVYEDNLIVVEEDDLKTVEAKIIQLLKKHHGLMKESFVFKYEYDLSSLFEKFEFLKITTVAKMAGLNDSLLRQYVTGNKNASPAQAKKIENTLHKIAKDLAGIKVYAESSL